MPSASTASRIDSEWGDVWVGGCPVCIKLSWLRSLATGLISINMAQKRVSDDETLTKQGRCKTLLIYTEFTYIPGVTL